MARLSFTIFFALIATSACLPKPRAENRTYEYSFPLLSRAGWGARDATSEQTRIGFPVPFVTIHHTYIPGACFTVEACAASMRSMQDFHQLTNGWSDIGYTFAVGGEGTVFEGRGWDTVGAHAVGVNTRSVGIALIGDFVSQLPTAEQLQGVKNLINAGVELGYISPDYRLIGHRAVSATECPGQTLFDEISTWDHFFSGEIEPL